MNSRVLSSIREDFPEMQRVRKPLPITLGTETFSGNGYVTTTPLCIQQPWKVNIKSTWRSTEPCALRQLQFFWILV